MPIKTTLPPEGAEDRFSFSHFTGPETKLNEETCYFWRKSPGCFWGMKLSPLPGAFHTIMVQSQTIPSGKKKKTGLCGKEPIQTAPDFYKREMFWSLKQPKRTVWSSSNSFILDSCKFLFCRFTSLENSIFNWTSDFYILKCNIE